MKEINKKGFVEDKYFLSNFYPTTLVIPELSNSPIPTAEHAFQAFKTNIPEERLKVLSSSTPALSKRAGRRVTLKKDWDCGERLIAMKKVIDAKFSDSILAQKLIKINGPLIEYNTWHDNYFGSCTCQKCGDSGKNILGELLMAKRAELRSFK